MGELLKLSNIGKVVEEQLNQIGVFTAEELRTIGSKQAWLKIQEIDETACVHRLMALEGALRGVKADLKAFYQRHKYNASPK